MGISIWQKIRMACDSDYTRRNFPPAPFHCGYCGKNFGEGKMLEEHMLDNHGWLYDQMRRDYGGIS